MTSRNWQNIFLKGQGFSEQAITQFSSLEVDVATALAYVNGGSLPVVTVAASGDATGVTDRAAIQAAHDALPARGGSIGLASGAYYLNAAVTFTKPVTLIGHGGGLAGDAGTTPAVALTTIYCTSATANGFTVSAAGCCFRDFALVNIASSTPTAGAGILDTLSSNSSLERVTILGFWNLLDVGGSWATVTACHLYDAVNYYVYIHAPISTYNDNCVTLLTGTVISPWNRTYVANALFRYESGGGSKLTGCYLCGGSMPGNTLAGQALYGVDLAVADGILTSSLTISGCTISGNRNAHIRIGQKGPTYNGRFDNVVIVGNEITAGLGTANLCVGILVGANAAGDNSIRDIHISDNVFSYLNGGGIKAYNMAGLTIGTNTFGMGMTGPLIDLSSSPDNGTLPSSARVDVQNWVTIDSAATMDVILDHRAFSVYTATLDGGVVYDYTKQAYISVNAVWTTLFVLGVTNAAGGLLDFTVAGMNDDGTGSAVNQKGVLLKQLRAYEVSTAGVVTLTTVGTDSSIGAGAANCAIQYVLTANTITVQVQTTSAVQKRLLAQGRLKVDGRLTKFHLGA